MSYLFETSDRATRRAPSTLCDPRFEFEFAYSWLLSAIEFVAITLWYTATTLACQRVMYRQPYDVVQSAAVAVMTATIFCGAERLFRAAPPTCPQRRRRFLRTITIWLGSFLFLAVLATALRVPLQAQVDSLLVFFVSGPPLLFLTRRLAASCLKNARSFNKRLEGVLIGCNPEELTSLGQFFHVAGQPTPSAIIINVGDGWDIELQRTIEHLQSGGFGTIYLCSEGLSYSQSEELLHKLRQLPREVRIVPDSATARLFLLPRRFGPEGLSIEMQKQSFSKQGLIAKRAFDLVVSLMLILLVAPLMVVIAVAIKLDSKGPVFFRQSRLGLWGRAFRIFKFRSMRVMEDGEHVTQAVRNDQRITRVGLFLRKSSLDELPQLFNIVAGHMSLVGPRPHAVAHDRLFADLVENYGLRQHVKPGLTGWAQVNGFRGETASVEMLRGRVEHDIWYVRNGNLKLDMKIMLRTVAVVFGRENAY